MKIAIISDSRDNLANLKKILSLIKETKLVNPGNMASLFFKPTFAIYDSNINKLKLKIL